MLTNLRKENALTIEITENIVPQYKGSSVSTLQYSYLKAKLSVGSSINVVTAQKEGIVDFVITFHQY